MKSGARDREAKQQERADILVLGLGNPILSDDGVGIHVVRKCQRSFHHPRVHFRECSLAGFDLLTTVSPYRRLIVVDASCWGDREPGTVAGTCWNELRGAGKLLNFHTLSLPGLMALADRMDIPRPEEVLVITVEAEDTTTFSEHCTPAVERAIGEACRRVLAEIEKIIGEDSCTR